jgi:hypothetical protein
LLEGLARCEHFFCAEARALERVHQRSQILAQGRLEPFICRPDGDVDLPTTLHHAYIHVDIHGRNLRRRDA